MVALLLSLFANRLLINVEVLVVGIVSELVVDVLVVVIRLVLQLELVLVFTGLVGVLLIFGGALRWALRMGDMSCEVGVALDLLGVFCTDLATMPSMVV